MEKSILWIAGIKKHIKSLLGITVLLFLVSLSLSVVYTVSISGGNHIRLEMQRAGFGNLTAWVSEVIDMEALTDSIAAQEGIEKVELQNIIFSDYEANGVKSDSEGQIIAWHDGEAAYRFFQDDLSGYRESPEKIVSGHVYVSPSMRSVMDLQIGDTVQFAVARDGKGISLRVAGYYEDPFMGSSMIGMKGFLAAESDYEAIIGMLDTAGMNRLARTGAMIHIFTNADSDTNIYDMNRLLLENTPISQYAEFIHSAKAIKSFMGILQNAYCGILATFVLILLIVVMVVLGNSIAGIIEEEYTNFGILKAQGFTGRQLLGMQIGQYVAAMAVGIVLGLLTAFPVTGMIAGMTVPTTGMLIPKKLPLAVCLGTFLTILLVLSIFTALQLKPIISITPVRSIRGEIIEKAWSDHKLFKIREKGLSVRLAVRQLQIGKRRYVSACLVAILLVFFASLTGRMNSWLGADGKGMMDAFHPADLDIGVQVLGALNQKEVEETIRSYTEITDDYLLAMPSVSVQGNNFTANVITEPERFHMSQGITCLEADEVVLTDSAASDLGIKIGEKIMIRGNMGSQEFTVSGIYHCANDMGANIGMNREGYLSIATVDPKLWCKHYFLADTSQREAIMQSLASAYGGDVHVHENTWPGLNGIIAAMQGLLVFMYTMIALFIFMVTAMTGSKILLTEQKDMGIYKSIGFPIGMLRFTFSIRFGMTAMIGAVVGTIAATMFTDPLVASVMRMAGISNFASSPSVFDSMLPGVTVIILFFCFSYLQAGKLKKTDISLFTVE